jgi:hypothetical protein
MADWTFDLTKVTRRQYSDFRLGKLGDDQDNAILADVTGMTADMIEALPLIEFRQLVRAFFRKATEPLADPNSPAPSSTP